MLDITSPYHYYGKLLYRLIRLDKQWIGINMTQGFSVNVDFFKSLFVTMKDNRSVKMLEYRVWFTDVFVLSVNLSTKIVTFHWKLSLWRKENGRIVKVQVI